MSYRQECPLGDPPTCEEQEAAADDGLTYDFGLSETGAQCWKVRQRGVWDAVPRISVEVDDAN